MLRPAKSLRFRIADDGNLYVSLSSSSGEFFLGPEILELLRLIASEGAVAKTGAAKKLRKRLQDTLDKLPSDDEILQLVTELSEAGVLVDPKASAGRALQQDGFGDPWVQWTMLADETRTRCYLNAIEKTVKKGDVVVDLGAGTGVLTIAALESGAKKVFAIEETDIARTLRKTVADVCGKADRLSVFNGNSADFESADKVDVVLSELFGNDPFCEGVLVTLSEFAERVKGKPKYLPESVTCYVEIVDLVDAPMSARMERLIVAQKKNKAEDLFERLVKHSVTTADFSDVSFAFPLRKNNFVRASAKMEIGQIALSPVPELERIKFGGKFKVKAKSAAAVPALLLYFRAQICGEHTLSNHPCEKDFAEHWSPIIVPLRCALALDEVVEVEARLSEEMNRVVLTIKKGAEVIGARA